MALGETGDRGASLKVIRVGPAFVVSHPAAMKLPRGWGTRQTAGPSTSLPLRQAQDQDDRGWVGFYIPPFAKYTKDGAPGIWYSTLVSCLLEDFGEPADDTFC